MSSEKVKDQIRDLTNKLNEWNKEYYLNNNTIVSDETYDANLKKLKTLEEKHPNLILDNSPTQNVGTVIISKFEKEVHESSMLSLNNAFNEKDMLKFFEDIEKLESKEVQFCCEHKIDGVSISLIYEGGKLRKAITRGDGKIGELVTHNIRNITTLPKVINEKERVTLRGEVFFSKKAFNTHNSYLKSKDKKTYKNPRNAASGLLRQLDSSFSKKANLSVWFYDILETKELNIKTQGEIFGFLRKYNFPINESYKILNKKDVNNFINNTISKRDSLDYQIDGVVVKVNNLEKRKQYGTTSKFPKWAIAYKLPAEIAQTKVIRIFATIGRTGKITYNAELEPVLIAGTTVSFATLHNYDWLSSKDIRVGDTVDIKKAGDIIPEVIRPLLDYRDKNSLKFEIIEKCPECNSTLHKDDEITDQFCINENCKMVLIKKLTHFVSRKATNLNTISEATITFLFNKGWLKNIDDFFLLETYEEQWKKEKGFSTKSVNNILQEIKKLKEEGIELGKLIFSLGIKHVGSVSANKVAEAYSNIQSLKEASINELLEVKDIGEKSAAELYRFFEKEANSKLINSLQEKVKILEPISKTEVFKDKVFVITGTLSKPRNHFSKIINENSGSVSSSISKNTSYLLCGDNAGSKKEKALKLGVKIINELEFETLLKNG